jgi:hypothetical protein
VLPEIVSAGSAVVAIAALVRATAIHRKFVALSQSYWELRYESARLRARVAKLDGGQTAADPEDPTIPNS